MPIAVATSRLERSLRCLPVSTLLCLYRYPLKLAGFWTAQSVWGWIVLLPVTVSQVRTMRRKCHAAVPWRSTQSLPVPYRRLAQQQPLAPLGIWQPLHSSVALQWRLWQTCRSSTSSLNTQTGECLAFMPGYWFFLQDSLICLPSHLQVHERRAIQVLPAPQLLWGDVGVDLARAAGWHGRRAEDAPLDCCQPAVHHLPPLLRLRCA